jgi:hypothetical protein
MQPQIKVNRAKGQFPKGAPRGGVLPLWSRGDSSVNPNAVHESQPKHDH